MNTIEETPFSLAIPLPIYLHTQICGPNICGPCMTRKGRVSKIVLQKGRGATLKTGTTLILHSLTSPSNAPQ